MEDLVEDLILEEEKKLHRMILAVSSLLRTRKKRNLFFVAENGESFRHIFPRIARKLRQKDFVNAETFADRDRVCRAFAAECFEQSKFFATTNNERLSLQYAKLAARLLGMSLRPKKLSDLDEIKKELARLKAENPEH